MLVLLIILMGLCLGAGGCASRIYAHSALVSGDSPSAELVVLREREFSLGTLALLVSLDEEKLARLRIGRFAEFRIQPGNYQLAIGNLGIPGRVKRVVFDPIQLAAGTRTYVIFGKQGELRWNDTKTTPYCLTGRCGRIGKNLRSESITLVFGFDRLTEGEAKTLMTKYEPVRARLPAMSPEEKPRMRERDVAQAENGWRTRRVGSSLRSGIQETYGRTCWPKWEPQATPKRPRLGFRPGRDEVGKHPLTPCSNFANVLPQGR